MPLTSSLRRKRDYSKERLQQAGFSIAAVVIWLPKAIHSNDPYVTEWLIDPDTDHDPHAAHTQWLLLAIVI